MKVNRKRLRQRKLVFTSPPSCHTNTNLNDLNNTANEANNLVISKSDLNIQNQIKISQTPIELNKLLDQ